jgi:hypothetical protein
MLDQGRGNTVRAQIGSVFSTIGKQLSGGAITASEFSRLERFLPSTDDDYDKLKAKLDNLEREYSGLLQRRLDLYGESYRTPNASVLMGQPRQTQMPTTQQAPAGPRASGGRPPLSQGWR